MVVYNEKLVDMEDLYQYLRGEANRGYEVVSIFPVQTKYYKLPVPLTEARPKSLLNESHISQVLEVCVVTVKKRLFDIEE